MELLLGDDTLRFVGAQYAGKTDDKSKVHSKRDLATVTLHDRQAAEKRPLPGRYKSNMVVNRLRPDGGERGNW
jgi:hypothetical protein